MIRRIFSYVARKYSEYRTNSTFGEHLDRAKGDLLDIRAANTRLLGRKLRGYREDPLLRHLRARYIDQTTLRGFIRENSSHPDAPGLLMILDNIDNELWFNYDRLDKNVTSDKNAV